MTIVTARIAVAFALVALVPLPSIRSLVGVDLPAGLNPVNVLVLVALLLLAIQRPRVPVREAALVVALGAVHFALLVVAWLRTSPDSVALVGNWLVVPLAGALAAVLLPKERRGWWLGAAFALSLAILGGSVLAEAAGLYDPPVPDLVGPLEVKPNGGFMLQANEAGALYATYAVPAALLIRDRSPRLAVLLLTFSLAVVLVTRSRESVAVFLLALLAAAVATGRVRSAARAALTLVAAVSLWAIAVPGAFAGAHTDPNYFLRGRPTLWSHAIDFLREDLHWLIGGGLESFEAYVRTTELRYEFTTHNEAFRTLVDGGALLFGIYVALAAVVLLLAVRTTGVVGVALGLAIGSFLLIGVFKDFGFYTRSAGWLWALVMLALLVREREGVEGG